VKNPPFPLMFEYQRIFRILKVGKPQQI